MSEFAHMKEKINGALNMPEGKHDRKIYKGRIRDFPTSGGRGESFSVQKSTELP